MERFQEKWMPLFRFESVTKQRVMSTSLFQWNGEVLIMVRINPRMGAVA